MHRADISINEACRGLASNVQHRASRKARFHQARDGIGHAWPRAGEDHAQMAGHARIGIRHMRAAHLSARLHIAQTIALADCIQHRNIMHGHNAEDGRNTNLRQEFRHQIGDGIFLSHGAASLFFMSFRNQQDHRP